MLLALWLCACGERDAGPRDQGFALEKVGRWQSPRGVAGIALGLLAALVSFPAVRILARLVRLVRRGSTGPGREPRWHSTVAHLTVLVEVAFCVTLVAALADWRALLFGPTPLLRAALALPFLAIAGTLAMGAFSLQAWRSGSGSASGRLHYTLVALASAGLLWLAYEYNAIALL